MPDPIIKNFPDDFVEQESITADDKLFVNADNYITGQNLLANIPTNGLGSYVQGTTTIPTTLVKGMFYFVPSGTYPEFGNFNTTDSANPSDIVPANQLWMVSYDGTKWNGVQFPVDLVNYLNKANIGVDVASQIDLSKVLQNGGTTSYSTSLFSIAGAFNASNVFVDTNDWRRTDYQAGKKGDAVTVQSITNATTLPAIVFFDTNKNYVSKVSLDTANVLGTATLTLPADGFWIAQYRYASQAGIGSATVTSEKIYLAPTDKDVTSGVVSFETGKKIAANNTVVFADYTASTFDSVQSGKSINPTTGVITDDANKDLHVKALTAGQLVKFKTYVWGVDSSNTSGYVEYVVLKSDGTVLTYKRNTSTAGAAGADIEDTYTATETSTIYVSRMLKTFGTTNAQPYTPSIAIADSTTMATYTPKAEKAVLDSYQNGDVKTTDSGTIRMQAIYQRLMTASSTQTGYYGATTTASLYDVIVKLLTCKVGYTYTLNWTLVNDQAVYTPVRLTDGNVYYKKLDITNNTFTIPASTSAEQTSDSFIAQQGVIIQLSTNDNQVGYSVWSAYNIKGYASTNQPVQTKLKSVVLGYGGLQNTRMNLYELGAASSLTNDGTSDFSTVLKTALDTISQSGGGKLWIPKGDYIVNNVIVPSNVTLEGEDKFATRFFATGQNPIFRTNGTLYFRPISASKNIVMRNFTMDGSKVTGTTYNVSYKGAYMLYLEDCTFEDLLVLNTGATGFGCDFFRASTIRNITARNCGRLVTSSTDPGGSGIGIGTNDFNYDAVHQEACILTGLHAYDCGQFGIFIEAQDSGYDTLGYRITDSYAEGCRIGFGASGGAGAIFANCTSYLNDEAGFSSDNGSFEKVAQRVSKKVIFANCVAAYNGTADVDVSGNDFLAGNGFQYKGIQPTSGFMLTGCEAFGNKGDGFIAYNADSTLDCVYDVMINGGLFSENGRHGLHFLNGTMHNVVAKPEIVRQNGRNGVYMNANMDGLILKDGIYRNNTTGLELASGKTIGASSIVKDNLVTDNTNNLVNLIQG